MIVNLSQYDLVISYSWGTNPHGICGHTYEVIEYFHILQQHFNCCILLCEDITPETLEYAVREKYDFTEQELANLLSRTVYAHLPQLVRGKNILITDGGVVKLKNVTLLFDNIFMFACGNPSVKDNTKSNTYILQDNRVYEPVNVNGINYKKKILFSRLKKILPTPTNTNLLYLTTNCRLISQHMLDEIVASYDGDFLCIVNSGHVPYVNNRVRFVIPPVSALFAQFDRYIYTPVPRKFDCSPRFIAECVYYGKAVNFHIDYMSEDKGLFWRWHDVQRDFESLHLHANDEIITIIGDIIENTPHR